MRRVEAAQLSKPIWRQRRRPSGKVYTRKGKCGCGGESCVCNTRHGVSGTREFGQYY